jgi:hypothetical protein
VPAGDVSFHRFLTLADAAGGKHPAFDDGVRWNPLGAIVLAESQVSSDVVVAAGTTVAVISTTASFAGIGRTAQVTLTMPELEFTASPGGECTFSVTLAGTPYLLGHCSVKGPFAWPVRLVRQLPVPGAGSCTFAVSCTSISQPVVIHSDAGASYGPLSLSVRVVG